MKSSDPHVSKRRNEILRHVENGELTPDEAEVLAAEEGLGPFTRIPPTEQFDPTSIDSWTLPMAIAWIAWRSIDAVRDQWPAYCAEFREWNVRRWRVGFEGEATDGYFLQPRTETTLDLLEYDEIIRLDTDRYGDQLKSIAVAKAELVAMLQEGVIVARGCEHYAAPALDIPIKAWHRLALIEENDRDILTFDPPRINGVQYVTITIPKDDLQSLWPGRVGDVAMPMVVEPDGSGHMPFFSAAQWMATFGGQQQVGPQEADRWQSAYEQLVERASSGQIEVSGIADGIRQTVDPVVFAGCRVLPPFAPAPDAPQLPDELCLVGQPFLSQEAWMGGVDDSLRNRRGRRWSKLMVSKADIASIPLSDTAGAPRILVHTGRIGRPTSQAVVRELFERRRSQGEPCSSQTAEARSIRDLWKRLYGDREAPALSTIRRHIKDFWRSHQGCSKPE